MIRVVWSVAVAAALLSASLPAVEAVAAERTAADLDRVSDRLDRAAAGLLASAPAETGDAPTARRVLSIRVPRATLTAAGVRVFALCPTDHTSRAVVVYAVADRPPVRRPLGGSYAIPETGIVLSAAGVHHLVFSPVRIDTGRETAKRRVRVRTLATSGVDQHADSNTRTGPPAVCDSNSSTVSADPR